MAKRSTINRELSWLSFNGRVLQEALDPDVPLVERIRFLGIFSNNLDEFYRVRVAALRRLLLVEKGAKKAMGQSPHKILEKIQKSTVRYQAQFDAAFEQLKQLLAEQRIHLNDERTLDEQQALFLRQYFNTYIAGHLSPVMLRSSSFPELADQCLYLAVRLSCSRAVQRAEYALMEVPTRLLPRFVVLPQTADQHHIILLEDVIRLNLHRVFGILPYDRFEAYIFKITRDAELDMDNDIAEGLLRKLEKAIGNRQKGAPVRLVHDADMPADMLRHITDGLALDQADNIIAGGRYHNFKDFIRFPDFGNPKLLHPPMPPVPLAELEAAPSLIAVMAQHDFMLHYPYHSFAHFIRYLQEASIDPKVRALYITLYRVSAHSMVVNALITAAQNGKQVTAVVEPQARFDEQSNIYWARRLQDAGANVVLGVPGLKVHCKLTMVVRKENGKERLYATVGTGNFHEGNASLYTDLCLFTANPQITNEVQKVFSFMQFNYRTFAFRHLMVSPFNMRRKLYKLIDNEITNAQAKKPAQIMCKINHLVDEEMIAKLYEASQAGVKINLLIRGTCSLIPGIKGLSDNIEVYSIVDRLLEHSRIYLFANGGDELCFISSSDWMTRNLDRRVEVACPILDRNVQAEVRAVLDYAMRDNVKARIVGEQQDNAYRQPNKKQRPFRSQVELYEHYRKQQHAKKR